MTNSKITNSKMEDHIELYLSNIVRLQDDEDFSHDKKQKKLSTEKRLKELESAMFHLVHKVGSKDDSLDNKINVLGHTVERLAKIDDDNKDRDLRKLEEEERKDKRLEPFMYVGGGAVFIVILYGSWFLLGSYFGLL